MYRFHRWFTLVLALILIGCGSTATPEVSDPTETSPTTAAAVTDAPPATVATPTMEDTDAYPGPVGSGYPQPQVYDPYPDAEGASPSATAGVSDPYAEPEDDGTASPMTWSADGVISQGEYAHQTTIGPVTVYWSSDQEYLYLAAEAQTTGWLSVGLDPDDRMLGADFLMAAEVDGPMAVYDSFGHGRTGPTHPLDIDEGGTSDIIASAVVQEGGWTRFEAQRPLVSGDRLDKPLSPRTTYPIIVATGSAAGFSAPHSFRDAGQITLD